MRIAVKICGLTRPEHVTAAIEAGADALGLVFDRGPCRLDLHQARTVLAAAEGAAVERVAVVGTLDRGTRAEIGALGFDLLQVDAEALRIGPEAQPLLPAFFDDEDLVDRVRRYRAAFRAQPAQPGSLVGTVNVDGRGGGGTGTRADWDRASLLAREGPLTLSGGLRVENLAEALRTVRPHAVDVSSGVEASPGIKDPNLMRRFVAEVRLWEADWGEEA